MMIIIITVGKVNFLSFFPSCCVVLCSLVVVVVVDVVVGLSFRSSLDSPEIIIY